MVRLHVLLPWSNMVQLEITHALHICSIGVLVRMCDCELKFFRNQGLFKYWAVKQIPNFLLALPCIALSLLASFCIVPSRSSTRHPIFIALSLHLLFLTITAITSMHVQVITRFVCAASPLFHIYTAQMLDSKLASFVKLYYRLFFVVGVVLHSTFLPWT
jgi:phosphatidylinositol glycan class V